MQRAVMGVKITSIAQIPSDVDIPYYVYLLTSQYPFESNMALQEAFDILAREASEHDFVVLQGLTHEFGGEVMNAYSIDGIPVDDLLAAILISTVNPHQFEQVRSIDTRGPFRRDERVVFISLRQEHPSRDDVFRLVQQVLSDVRAGRDLSDFACVQGGRTKFLDSLVIQPNFSGVGVDLKTLWDFLRGK